VVQEPQSDCGGGIDVLLNMRGAWESQCRTNGGSFSLAKEGTGGKKRETYEFKAQANDGHCEGESDKKKLR